MRAVGLMSGTSLDGIDAALVDIVPAGDGYAISLVAASTTPFDPGLERRIHAALPPHEPAPSVVAALDVAVGDALGRAAAAVAGAAPIGFVASHGLTLYHDGAAAQTAQIGDPFVIRELAGATVLSDFRRADCAAGGHGAPLVPYADALLFASATRFVVVLNIGGIANATLLFPGCGPADALAWDIGPGNMLIDGFVRRRSAGGERLDSGGARALRGTVVAAVVDGLFADPYFALEPPKSTGRERFGDAFLDRHAPALDGLSFDDGCATLAALTVRAIAAALCGRVPSDAQVFVGGGGARNRALCDALATALAPRSVAPVDVCGVDCDAKEAIAFVVLGYELLRGREAGLPRVTGAAHPALLGSIAPRGLAALLGAVDEEVRSAKTATRRL